jgi:multiple antibiotic resistance protein
MKHRNPRLTSGTPGRRDERRHARPTVSLAVGIGVLLCMGGAIAAEAVTGQPAARHFPLGYIFTFLFLMLGPFKIIGPFAQVTKGADAATTRRIALWATFFASLALAFAAVLGERLIGKYGIPVPILGLAAGIILFLVALMHVSEQFKSPEPTHHDAPDPATTPAMQLALKSLAFPTIVTPYGIAALVVFMALSPDLQGRLSIGAVVMAIMLLNLSVMLVTRRILPVVRVVLPIVGAVLGVVQVALGLQIINNSLRALLAS